MEARKSPVSKIKDLGEEYKITLAKPIQYGNERKSEIIFRKEITWGDSRILGDPSLNEVEKSLHLFAKLANLPVDVVEQINLADANLIIAKVVNAKVVNAEVVNAEVATLQGKEGGGSAGKKH